MKLWAKEIPVTGVWYGDNNHDVGQEWFVLIDDCMSGHRHGSGAAENHQICIPGTLWNEKVEEKIRHLRRTLFLFCSFSIK